MTRVLLLLGGAIVMVPWRASQLGQSARTSWTNPQTLVVRDSAAWRDAWAQLHPSVSQRPALPAVDFAAYRVFIVAAGNRPSGGYRLALDEGHVAGDSALITVTAFTPPPGCGVTQEITTPALAIAAPVTPAAFRIITRTRPDSVRCN